jgi:hypothetical protein
MHRLFLLLVLVASAVHAAPADDSWMSVLLGGRKIGSMHTTRSVHDGMVTTRQTLHIEFDRAGTRVALQTDETDEETPAGQPLGFESRTSLSGSENVVRGTLRADGMLEVHSSIGGAAQSRSMPWPRGALLAEGLRLAEARAGTTPGTQYTNLAFQADSLEAIPVDSRIGTTAAVDLPDGTMTLTRVDQVIRMAGGPARATAWVDAEQTVRKLVMPVMGYDLTMLACSRECALAANQSADILVHALVPAPRAPSAAERREGLILSLRASDGGEALQLPQTDEQHVQVRDDGSIEVTVRPDAAGAAREPAPDASDRAPNDWLQSTAPEIVALAARGAGSARSPRAQMQNLEDFVRGYIRGKNLSVGYASALEVARKPEGDCTEHAVLLAALGRARGIATRVVDGVVYIDEYAGQPHVFVPHAWAQAWIDGRWHSFDAALHGFDAGHIALSFGDGDPWRFFAGFNALGRIRIDSIAPALAVPAPAAGE